LRRVGIELVGRRVEYIARLAGGQSAPSDERREGQCHGTNAEDGAGGGLRRPRNRHPGTLKVAGRAAAVPRMRAASKPLLQILDPDELTAAGSEGPS